MLLVSRCSRPLNRTTLRHVHNFNAPFAPQSTRYRGRASRVGAVAIAGLIGGSLLFYGQKPVYSDTRDDERYIVPRQPTPLSSLIRTYVVYTLCSMPTLVDWSPAILNTLLSIPGARQITEAGVRATFFSQFVGGESAKTTLPLLEQLRSENKGALFAYSVEVDEHEAAGKARERAARVPVHKQLVDEMIRCIDVAADFEDQKRADKATVMGRRTWVALKLTALLPDALSLINLSRHLVDTRPKNPNIPFPGCPQLTDLDVLDTPLPAPGSSLTSEDLTALKDLHEDLIRICIRARERGVRIIVDAEYSWYQPAIDAFTLSLTQQFNKLPPRQSYLTRAFGRTPKDEGDAGVQPLIYGTYQAYLTRTLPLLAQSFIDAAAGNYALGVKLVRGAYHPHELAAHPLTADAAPAADARAHASLSISPDAAPPVWRAKHQTDAFYNLATRLLIARVTQDLPAGARGAAPTVGVLFGTHNWASCDVILDAMVEGGLAVREPLGGGRGDVLRIGEAAAERVTLGQLYGMSDALTNSLVDRTRSAAPFVIKYVPYGALNEVMPYLSRRAIENKSVLGDGGAAEERRRAGAEIRRRIFG